MASKLARYSSSLVGRVQGPVVDAVVDGELSDIGLEVGDPSLDGGDDEVDGFDVSGKSTVSTFEGSAFLWTT